ncbi:SH3 domain-containing protein [Devosia sp. 66-14]
MSQHAGNNGAPATSIPGPVPSVTPNQTEPDPSPAPPKAHTVPRAVPATPATHFVTADTLRVRALPSTGSSVMSSLRRGDTVSVLGSDGAWALVSLGPDRNGWVSMQYLAEIGAAPPRQSAFQAPTTPSAPTQSKPKPAIGQPLRDAYVGTCDCPYDRKRNGARCGGTSAYSRPGGRSPACYVGD